MSEYFNELVRTMTWLGCIDKVRFIGQATEWDGHALFKTMRDVPMKVRLELPVFEDFQMGMSLGLALEGWLPINIYPRFDFLIIASNQLINHLTVIRSTSRGKITPRVISRVSVGSKTPMHPGPQHCQDYTDAIRMMCRNEIEVVSLRIPSQIFSEYRRAVSREDCKPTILVEYGDLY